MPGTGTGEALHRIASLPRAGGLWQHIFDVQPGPPLWLILGSGVLALAVVASSTGLAGGADCGDDRA